ncbi:MAG: hypothetical protein ACPGSI_16070 [Pikeienuella sp.]
MNQPNTTPAPLANMLARYDDAALIGLASKGLLRRAERDLASGGAAIIEQTDSTATVQAAGQTVEIDSNGPRHARCPCPAPGVCRHILLTVLALQSAAAPDAAPPNAAPGDASPPNAPPSDAASAGHVPRETIPQMGGVTDTATACDEITAMAEEKLRRFAGADWAAALTLATETVTIDDSGRSCTVTRATPTSAISATNSTTPGSTPAITVTFIAGLTMQEAAYKGPQNRARLFVTAAALAIRLRAGVPVSAAALPEGTGTPRSKASAPITPAFCQDVGDSLETALQGVVTGSADIAADGLFDIAISARAGAAPRLAAQLRALSVQAGQCAAGEATFNPRTYLEACARCYALAHALRQRPDDPVLSGVIARTYNDAAPLTLWILGAQAWQTEAGARGLTVHACDRDTGKWYAAVTARAAGQDLAFNPRAAYEQPLWNGASPRQMTGKGLYLPHPRVASDARISGTLPAAAQPIEAPLTPEGLAAIGFADWASFASDMTRRRGQGLKRAATPTPALLLPTAWAAPAFDEFAQVSRLPIADRNGAWLDLHFPARHAARAEALFQARANVHAVLITARPNTAFPNSAPHNAARPTSAAGQQGTAHEVVAVVLNDQDGLQVVNLDFHALPRNAEKTGVLSRLRARFAPPPPTPDPVVHDPLVQLGDEVTEALLDTLRAPTAAQGLITRLQTAGLSTMATVAARAFDSRKPADILVAAYLVAEFQATLSP